jgi:hypothetical protein
MADFGRTGFAIIGLLTGIVVSPGTSPLHILPD